MNKNRARAVFFDMDGTLGDTFPNLLVQFNQLLTQAGKEPLDFPGLVSLLGPTEPAILQPLMPECSLDELEQKLEQAIAEGDDIPLFPRIGDLLEDLRTEGILIGVYTGAGRPCGVQRLRRMGLADRVDAFLTADDIPATKPAPDGLLRLCADLKVTPGETVYIGDSHLDIQCARAAAMRSVGVLWGVSEAGTLLREGPDALAANVTELAMWLREQAGITLATWEQPLRPS